MQLVLESVATAIIFLTSFTHISKITFNMKETAAHFVLLILLTLFAFSYISLGADISALLGNIIYIFIMTIIANRKIKVLPLSFLYAVLTDIVYLLSGYIAGVALDFIFGPISASREMITHNWQLSILYLIITASLSILLSFHTGNFLIKRVASFTDELKKQLSIYILSGAVVILALFFINTFLHTLLTDAALINLVYALTLTVCFIFLIFAIFAFSDSMRKETELSKKNEILKNLQTYTDSVENMAFEVRKFRHDHANLMLGFYNHIKDKNMDKISEYYQKYMSSFVAGTAIADSRLDNLMHIKVLEIKSILSFKLLHAQHLGIDVHIEVRDTVGEEDVCDLVDLCRIVGILLDNAAEACKGIPQPTLKFNAFKSGPTTTFVFSNTCPSPPPLKKICEKGFTTKEGKRGLGLYSVSLLLGNHENIFLQTRIEEGEFVQILNVTPA